MATIYHPLVAGRERPCGKRFPVLDKYTGEPFAEAGLPDKADIEQALAAAYAARQAMQALSAHQRCEVVRKAAAILAQKKDEVSLTIAREAGKPYKYAAFEVERTIENLEYCAEEAKRVHGETVPLDAAKSGAGKVGYYERYPVGVVAAISPFNFPLNLAAHKLGPAVAAGCPVILKPATATPLSGLALANAFAGAGLPPGAISCLPGPGEQVGDALVTDHRIAKITFTGSRTVGERIIRQAGLKKVTMELGGNCGVAIDESVKDLDHAVKRCVFGAFYNQGQVCISVQRIFVHKSVFDKFLETFLNETKRLKVGNPVDKDTDIGPVISSAEADRIMAVIGEAKGQGARVLCGNSRDKNVVLPTVLTGTTPGMRIACEEVFGPAVLIEPVDSFEQGITRVEDSEYGLQAGVFTSDIDRALKAIRAIDVGGIAINDVPTIRFDHMPYGGNKGSGLGREGAKFAIEEMTTVRMVVFNPDPGHG
ncbi:MAG TPA: aldehyde dehydrogenase family protein [Candidatus Edwardsbacteria bacterium]|nr:aldehyde dehydrogenase family protein [Candidatus Edwardsbacteria bacterium]